MPGWEWSELQGELCVLTPPAEITVCKQCSLSSSEPRVLLSWRFVPTPCWEGSSVFAVLHLLSQRFLVFSDDVLQSPGCSGKQTKRENLFFLYSLSKEGEQKPVSGVICSRSPTVSNQAILYLIVMGRHYCCECLTPSSIKAQHTGDKGRKRGTRRKCSLPFTCLAHCTQRGWWRYLAEWGKDFECR